MWFLAALSLAVAFPAVAPPESLTVSVAGHGAPVVLIPGLSGSACGFRIIAPGLIERGHRVAIIELTGMGGAPRPRGADYSLTAQTRRLAAALDVLGIDGAVIVGHAVSASVALRLAADRPDLVRGVVCLEGGPAESAGTPGLRRTMRMAGVAKAILGPDVLRKRVRDGFVSASGDPSWVTDEVVNAYLFGPSRDPSAAIAAYLAMAESREPRPLEPRLWDIQCPVELLIGGARHPGAVPREEVDLLRRRLANFHVTVITGAGHFIHEENPGAVLDAVLRMLRASIPTASSGSMAALGRAEP